MTLQAVLRFYLEGREWTERYYLDPPANDLKVILDRLIDARMDIAARPLMLWQGSIKDLVNPGFPEVYEYNRTHRFRKANIIPIPMPEVWSEIPEHVVVMGWETLAGTRRPLWLGGIPTQHMQSRRDNYYQNLDGSFVDRLHKFRDALRGDNLNLQIRELTPLDFRPSADVKAIDLSGNGLYRIETVQDFPAVAKMKVRIHGSRGNNISRLRGIRRVTKVIDGRTFVIDRGPLPELGEVRYTGGAKVLGINHWFSKAFWRPVRGGFEEAVFLPDIRRVSRRSYPYGVVSKLRGGRSTARRGRKRKSP